MKRFFILSVIAALICACSGQNELEQQVSFKYRYAGPFTYDFINTSSGVTIFRWDFGDGQTSSQKDVTHKYAEPGTYIVTLTGTYEGVRYDARARVEVTKPNIYVAGYKLYKIPYENKYYMLTCVDDDLFTTHWGFSTPYTPLLDNSDMPYTWEAATPKIMDELDGDNYYTFCVYYSSTNSNTDNSTQCLKQTLSKTEILKYKDEHILTSSDGKTKIGILMSYD